VAIWAVTFFTTRYASVASIVTALALPIVSVALGEPWPVDVFAGLAAVAVLILHRTNIARLRAGTEKRFRFRRGPEPALTHKR
jgi:glycerol-3-phosphate acyltransferase PlsY